MSQALLTLQEPLSPPRIGGIAAALAVHVAALMMLMAPMTYAPPLPTGEEPVVTVFEIVKPPEPVIPPPVPTIKTVKPEVVPLVNTPVKPIETIPPIILDDGGINDLVYVKPVTEIPGDAVVLPAGPVSLSTEFAPPPRYPVASLRNGDQGTVMLLVKVDATGRPIEASIKKSSGYRELDKNAMKHVLATWRFHPAMHQGVAIPALALVPVLYRIDA